VENIINKALKGRKGVYQSHQYNIILVIPVISLKGCLILILFLHFNVVKSYREIKAREPVYLNNPFSHFRNKW